MSDLFVMGAGLILESLVIMNFCEREGFSPIIAHGISMGRILTLLGNKLRKEYHSKLLILKEDTWLPLVQLSGINL